MPIKIRKNIVNDDVYEVKLPIEVSVSLQRPVVGWVCWQAQVYKCCVWNPSLRSPYFELFGLFHNSWTKFIHSWRQLSNAMSGIPRKI